MVSSTTSTFTFGGPAGDGVVEDDSSPAKATAAISDRQTTIQSKRNPPGIITSQAMWMNRVSKTTRGSFQRVGPDASIDKVNARRRVLSRVPQHSSVAQWQSIRLLTGGL